jgi:hypothetical protein
MPDQQIRNRPDFVAAHESVDDVVDGSSAQMGQMAL